MKCFLLINSLQLLRDHYSQDGKGWFRSDTEKDDDKFIGALEWSRGNEKMSFYKWMKAEEFENHHVSHNNSDAEIIAGNVIEHFRGSAILSQLLRGIVEPLKAHQIPSISAVCATMTEIGLPKDNPLLFGILYELQNQWGATIVSLANGYGLDVTHQTVCNENEDCENWNNVLDIASFTAPSLLPKIFSKQMIWTGSITAFTGSNNIDNRVIISNVALFHFHPSPFNLSSGLKSMMSGCTNHQSCNSVVLARSVDLLQPIRRAPLSHLSCNLNFKFSLLKDTEESLLTLDKFKSLLIAMDAKNMCFLSRLDCIKVPNENYYKSISANVSEQSVSEQHYVYAIVWCDAMSSSSDSINMSMLNRRSNFVESSLQSVVQHICHNYPMSQLPYQKNHRESDVNSWIELIAWKESEHHQANSKSMMRLRSKEMVLGGIPLPPLSPDSSDANSVVHISSCFDSNGYAVDRSDFQCIPVIPDRLMSNIKSENVVKKMTFSEATNVLAHGIEYCLDSNNALKIDQRLTKIVNRCIRGDTKCSWDVELPKLMTNTKEPGNELKPVNPLGMQSRHTSTSALDIDKEKRSQRHKRRLRLIVEGTIKKYGKIPATHQMYDGCCQRLYSLCKSFLKDLKSSEGLKERMKELAKANVKQVIDFELNN